MKAKEVVIGQSDVVNRGKPRTRIQKQKLNSKSPFFELQASLSLSLSLSLKKMKSSISFIIGSLWISMLTLQTCGDQIITARVGGSVIRRSREPKFRIEFHSEDSPYIPDEAQESVFMPDEKGNNHLCFLPKVEKPKSGKSVGQYNTSSMIMESEKRMKVKTPDELLALLEEHCLFRQDGWWTYEFCYKKKLRQLHLEDEKIVQEFVLGVYDPEATEAYNQNLSDISILKDPHSKDASRRYHAHQYTNGTTCDLTNEPRETEARFVCSEGKAMISSITELATCKYALTVHSPMLCAHPLFQEERPVWHTINCNVIPKDEKETVVGDNQRDNDVIEMPGLEYRFKAIDPESDTSTE